MKRILLFVLSSQFVCPSLFSQNINVTLQGTLKYPGENLANIWGYVDNAGNEYALVGASKGMSVVDVSTPSAPVEVKKFNGITSNWREIRSYRNYIYITTEGGGGLQIVDLKNLPSTTNLPSKFWAPVINGDTLRNIHSLHIDTAKKFVYLYGSNISHGGALAIDISDPWNPVYRGNHSAGSDLLSYIHDGMVMNDTLYGAHIYGGFFDVVDFRNKANPILLASQNTPGKFPHNTWLSDNHKVLFTTDEVNNSFLTAYDLSNLNNIKELDRIQSNPGSNSVVHNTYIKNDWAVTSWYKDGFTIVDVHRPQNLIEVGNYDTYTSGSGSGFSGAWGVYAYLPSGSILVSNIGEGLFVLSPTFVRACYLEGNVGDSICGGPLAGVNITINSTPAKDVSTITGDYKTGYYVPGTYSVTFSKPGYTSRTISNISLSAANIKILNIKLYSDSLIGLNGNIKNPASSPLAGTKVQIENGINEYSFVSDASGNFSKCNVVEGSYTIYAAKWGYETKCLSNQTISPTSSLLNYTLTPLIYDDFVMDLGWTVTGINTGAWARGVPNGTSYSGIPANPGADVSTDCSNKAWCTGLNGITSSDDDLDNGSTVLASPSFDLSTLIDPTISYYRWFHNSAGYPPHNDSLIVRLSNGIVTVPIEIVTSADTTMSAWILKTIQVKDFIMPTSNMKIIFYAVDASPGHIVEAGIDKFQVYEGPKGIADLLEEERMLSVFPNPFNNQLTIRYSFKIHTLENAFLIMRDVLGKEVYSSPIDKPSGEVVIDKNFDEGIYFIRIENGSASSETLKIIKLK